jgi:hypothetical protein
MALERALFIVLDDIAVDPFIVTNVFPFLRRRKGAANRTTTRYGKDRMFLVKDKYEHTFSLPLR